MYASGKALASGLGEAVRDRALADQLWLEERLAALAAGQRERERAKEWGRAAFARADLHLAMTTTTDRAAAAALERTVLDALAAVALWNRARDEGSILQPGFRSVIPRHLYPSPTQSRASQRP